MRFIRSLGYRLPVLPVVLVPPLVVVFWYWHFGAYTQVARIPWLTPRLELYLLALLLTLLLIRWLLWGSRRGPIVVGEIVDATGASGKQDMPAVIQALLRERIARAGQEPFSVVPSHGAMDVQDDVPVASPPGEGAVGFLTWVWLTTSRLRFPGWRLTATLRYNEDTSRHGLTVVLQHGASRQHFFTRTFWASNPHQAARSAAYEVAAWRQQHTSGVSTRRRPRWRPTAEAMGYYEDATYFAAERRLDEAIQKARSGLDADPTNMALRRALGDAYERLGHFRNALHIYASGIAMLLDIGNGWSQSVHTQETGEHQLAGWPKGNLTQARKAERPRRAWLGRDWGLLWRYIVVLGFSDLWVDRWIVDLERDASERRHLAARAAGTEPSMKDRFSPNSGHDVSERTEQAKRLRGFFHRRYQRLLAAEFPLLEQAWFAEMHERMSPFVTTDPDEHFCFTVPDVGLRQDPRPTPPAPQEEQRLDAMLKEQAERYPLSRGHERGTRTMPHDDPGTQGRSRHVLGELSAARGIDDLRAFLLLMAAFDDCVARERAVRRLPAGVEMGPDEIPHNLADLLAELRARLGVRRRMLPEVAKALTDRRRWEALGLDRQLVAGVCSWAAHRLVVLSETEATAPPPAGTAADAAARKARHEALALQLPRLEPEQLHLCRRVEVHLDLRSFFLRASMYEVDVRRGPRSLWGVGSADEALQDLQWVNARYRYLARLHQLFDVPERSRAEWASTDGGAADPLDADDKGRLAADDAPGRLKLETTTATRRLLQRRQRLRRSRTGPEEWSLWYYAACCHALTIPPPQNDGTHDEVHSEAPAGNALWKRRYDPFAEFAVRALNHAMIVRGRKGRTLIEAGAGDWMLHEDPDLDNLRMHPRFERWASATFATVTGNPAVGREVKKQYLRYRDALTQREYRNEGTFGMRSRWGPNHLRWWRINNHYLAVGVESMMPQIARGWRDMGARLLTEPVAAVALFRERMAQDRDVWGDLTDYAKLAADPERRARVTKKLALLAADRNRRRSYPTARDVSAAPKLVRYEVVDDLLAARAVELHAQEDRLKGILRPVQLGPENVQVLVGYCEQAAQRWEDLVEAIEAGGGEAAWWGDTAGIAESENDDGPEPGA